MYVTIRYGLVTDDSYGSLIWHRPLTTPVKLTSDCLLYIWHRTLTLADGRDQNTLQSQSVHDTTERADDVYVVAIYSHTFSYRQ